MSFSRWRQARSGADELNLIPVMNLFMVLIPFLLMGAAFFQIGVIPTSLPVNDPQQSDVPKTPTTVVVTLTLKEDKAICTIASVSLSPEELEALGKQWPRNKDKSYPAKAIQAYLQGLKKTYPKSNTVTVLPYDGLEYQQLVDVLDKVREVDTGKKDKNNEPIYAELFPVTIFSRLLIAPPSEEGGEEEGEASQ